MVQSNCKNDYESIFNRHYGDLVNFTAFLLNDREAAETVVVNLFVKIWHLYRDRFCTFENARTYLFRATYQEGKNYLIQKHVGPQAGSETDLGTSAVINKGVNQLPPILGKIAQLSIFENLPLSQVAASLQLSPLEVKNLMQKTEDLLVIAFHP
ncbi:MAG: hypothetical protein ABI675_02835 [Chitinophagaceae bacterium]